MIIAFQKDEVLLADIKSTFDKQEGFRIWWLGQSGFLLQWAGKHILLDPYLSDSLTKKYVTTDKPHVRMSELVIQPATMNFIDLVTSSHNHTDHLDGDTLIALIEHNPNMLLVIPEANRAFVSHRLGCDSDFPVGLNDQESFTSKLGFILHGIPAAHNELERDDQGRCKFMGYVIQFGGYTIYHSGDTLWHHKIIEALKAFDIDLAILPINGNRPERRVAGNLEAKEAVKMAKTIGAKMVIPCHYHLFEFNTVEPDEFIEEAKQQNQPYKILRIGERWERDELMAQ